MSRPFPCSSAVNNGTIVLLTSHELDINDGGGTHTYFRIDPPRLVATCIDP
jgi:hypothetical protein